MSGVTMRSIMSVSTVKVGTTIKSMNPGDKHFRKNYCQNDCDKKENKCKTINGEELKPQQIPSILYLN